MSCVVAGVAVEAAVVSALSAADGVSANAKTGYYSWRRDPLPGSSSGHYSAQTTPINTIQPKLMESNVIVSLGSQLLI